MERPMNQLALMATVVCFTLTLLGVAVSTEDHLGQARSWLLADMHDDDHHHDMIEQDYHEMDEGDEHDMLESGGDESMHTEDEELLDEAPEMMGESDIDDDSMYKEMDDSEFDEYEDGDVDIAEGDFEAEE